MTLDDARTSYCLADSGQSLPAGMACQGPVPDQVPGRRRRSASSVTTCLFDQGWTPRLAGPRATRLSGRGRAQLAPKRRRWPEYAACAVFARLLDMGLIAVGKRGNVSLTAAGRTALNEWPVVLPNPRSLTPRTRRGRPPEAEGAWSRRGPQRGGGPDSSVRGGGRLGGLGARGGSGCLGGSHAMAAAARLCGGLARAAVRGPSDDAATLTRRRFWREAGRALHIVPKRRDRWSPQRSDES